MAKEKNKTGNNKKETKKRRRSEPMSPKSGIGRRTKYACGGKLKK